MDICLIMIALVALAIFGLFAHTAQAVATICKHGGVTIRVIREEPIVTAVTPQEHELTKEEQDAIDKYNTEQSAFMSSIRNLQSIFIDSNQQATKEDKQ